MEGIDGKKDTQQSPFGLLSTPIILTSFLASHILNVEVNIIEPHYPSAE